MRRVSAAVWIVAVAGTAMCPVLTPRATAVTPSGIQLGTEDRAATATTGPLATGFLDPWSFGAQDQSAAYDNARRAGATVIRILLSWAHVVPGGATMPADFKPTDPGDPRYRFGQIDSEVRAATARGFTPIIFVYNAPVWAQSGQRTRPNDGPARPSPAALADFFTALTTRFSGSYAGLPRVRYWQVWNEPNLNVQLVPQSENGKVVSPDIYRAMVNAAARSIHAVHRDNLVVAGGLAPFGGNLNDPSGEPTPNQERIHPMQFMRQMLCMSKGAKPKATCNERSEFDVWAHHPYTYGGPTHSAFHPDDVSLGDMSAMRTLVDAAKAVGHIQSRQKIGFWVTEFSYDSKPADPKGLPLDLHARWVSESLYRMWSSGVTLVTWFLLRDQPFPDEFFQSGLYTRGSSGIASDKPKPALTAFRFPFVAFREKDRSISYWGRTPAGVKRAAAVEQKQGSRWVRLVTPKVDRFGILQGRIPKVRGNGPLRARLLSGNDASLPFSLKMPKDFRFCPWGSFC